VHRPNKRKWWKALYIIDMKVVDGKRLWRIAWSGYDDEGEPWEPSWEPTMNVPGDEGRRRHQHQPCLCLRLRRLARSPNRK